MGTEQQQVAAKCCVECGAVLTMENGYKNGQSKKGVMYLNSACRPCQIDRVKTVQKLKKKHPYPPDSKCQCCGRVSKLYLDHCHATGAYRGHICPMCNSAVGLLGDSAEGVRKALAYLEKNQAYGSAPAGLP